MSDISFVRTERRLDNGDLMVYKDVEVKGGDIVITTDYDRPEVESARQSILATLSVYRGEYFMDNPENPQYGVDYLGSVLGTKGVPEDVLNTIFTDAILSDRNVASILDLTVAVDRSARVVSVNFTCSIKSGEELTESINLSI